MVTLRLHQWWVSVNIVKWQIDMSSKQQQMFIDISRIPCPIPCLFLHELNQYIKAWFHERFFSAKCELFRLFFLNCEQSSRNNLFEWSQFKRNRRNISHFAEKKRSWNRALKVGNFFPLKKTVTLTNILIINPEDDYKLFETYIKNQNVIQSYCFFCIFLKYWVVPAILSTTSWPLFTAVCTFYCVFHDCTTHCTFFPGKKISFTVHCTYCIL
jgi:hypothetical protein